jgi:methyl-accepting chemotaxis protein
MAKFQPGIRLKLLGIVLLSAISLTAVGALALNAINNQLFEDRTTMVRSINDTAIAQANLLAKQVAAGTLGKDQAIATLREILHVTRFGDTKDYSYAYAMDGTVISNAGNTAIEGNNLIGKTGPDGRKVIAELIDAVKSRGKGSMIYLWPRPGQTDPVLKLVYFEGVPGLDLFIGTSIYIDDIDAVFRALAIKMVIFIGLLLLVTIALTWTIGKSITNPLAALGQRMRHLADGRLDEEILEADRGDEIGQMAATVFIFKQNALAMRRMEQEQEEVKRRAEAENRARLLQMAQSFESQVKDVAEQLQSSAQAMEGAARQMSETSERTGLQVADASQAAQESTQSVQTVASAAEELVASINEIGQQAAQSAGLTMQAVTEASDAYQVIEGLAGASAKIGEVVKLINDVAAQTNLLALIGPQCHHRGGAGGRGRQGLCRGGQ